ncbi:MAG: 2-iminoacetate synthase ThiH, partial [Candidatus Eremiobacteraeota bacterium]|nr:2-iminoacetate synthase ThiH [Candidatus Eremiobacteraeota bacterium]
MSFSQLFDRAPIDAALARLDAYSVSDVRQALRGHGVAGVAAAPLFSPAAAGMLEAMAQTAHQLTVERFGRTIGLYAPLYLSNECVCTCTYCGFSMGLDIKRRTLRIDEVIREARLLHGSGLRNILLVSAEHPKAVPAAYLAQCVREVKALAHYVGLEVAAATEADYAQFAAAGCDGVVLYQETYDATVYAEHHLGGPKKKYHWRLDAPERAAGAGIKHLGLGALLGLADWRFEALALLEHLRYVERRCWRSQATLSFPRINAAEGNYAPAHPVSDAQLVQLICAFRILSPAVGIVLSTRENATLRDALVRLGVTQM